MRVCVIGGGIAGLACALAAASRGSQVRLFETGNLLSVAPGYVEVIPSMMRDLVALGVGEPCVRAGFAFHGIQVIDRKGRKVGDIPTPRLAGHRYPAALGITHASLLRVLESAAVAHGVRIEFGTSVDVVESSSDRIATLHLASGDKVEADLVLLANGSTSNLRGALFPDAATPTEIDQAWWYTLVQRPLDLDRPRIALGSLGFRVVLVPVRTDVAGLAFCEPLACVPHEVASIGHLRKALLNFAPNIQALAWQLADDAPLSLRLGRSGVMTRSWRQSQVLAVGDCAHTLPPQFGQGAAQALEDAVVLGDLIATCPDHAALPERFCARRVPRVRAIHALLETAVRWGSEPELQTNLGALITQLASMGTHAP